MTTERRTRQRFPLILELRFTASKGGREPIRGRGVVVNISSQGVAFRTDIALAPDLNIEASIEWPVTLNGDCVLRVTVEGRVLRVQDGLSVMRVTRHEFRTGGRVGMPAPSELEVLKRSIGGLLAPMEPAHQVM